MRKRSIVFCLIVLIVIASGLRIVRPWQFVFPDNGEVRLLGADPFYQLRHATYVIRNYPTIQRWDVATHYPKGQQATSPGLFTLLLATASLATPDRLAEIAAWTPIVLGAGVIVLLFALGQRLERSGLLAAVFFVLFPGPYVTRSMLGYPDHHLPEILLALLIVLGLLHCFRIQRDPDAPSWWRPALLAALPLALFQFTWLGAPVYVVIVAVVLFLTGLFELSSQGRCNTSAGVCARYGIGVFFISLLIGTLLPNLVMHEEGYRLSLMASASLVVVLAPALWVSDRLARRFARPTITTVILAGLAIVVLSGVAQVETLGDKLALAFAPKVITVGEHRDLDFSLMFWNFGPLVVLAPFAVLWLRERSSANRLDMLIALSFTTVLLIWWWRTRDYGYVVSPFLALAAALGVRSIVAIGQTGWQRWSRRGLLGVMILIPVYWARFPLPSLQELDNFYNLDNAWVEATSWMKQHTPPPSVDFGEVRETPDNLDFDYPAGTYGVWSGWGYGNQVAHYTDRAVRWSQGADRQVVRWLFFEDEADAGNSLNTGASRTEKIRYVILDADTMGIHYSSYAKDARRRLRRNVETVSDIEYRGQRFSIKVFGDVYERSIAKRLYRENGAGLSGYRLVFASTQTSLVSYQLIPDFDAPDSSRLILHSQRLFTDEERRRQEDILSQGQPYVRHLDERIVYGAEIVPTVKIFELVEGARLVGRAPPGAVIRINLDLVSQTNNRGLEYSNETLSDDQGYFELVLPHATDRENPVPGTDFVALASYLVRLLDPVTGKTLGISEVEISEKAVQTGLNVKLDLRDDKS